MKQEQKALVFLLIAITLYVVAGYCVSITDPAFVREPFAEIPVKEALLKVVATSSTLTASISTVLCVLSLLKKDNFKQ